jgi:hypothetical protein
VGSAGAALGDYEVHACHTVTSSLSCVAGLQLDVNWGEGFNKAHQQSVLIQDTV